MNKDNLLLIVTGGLPIVLAVVLLVIIVAATELGKRVMNREGILEGVNDLDTP